MTEARKTQRLISLDAYRGAIMISLISHGFGFSGFEGHRYLGFLAHQTKHVPWEGLVYWDLIQPAFMFMVGVAMPFAFAKRISQGDSPGKLYLHAIHRAFNLVFIAFIFTSINRGEPTITLVNVLPQIAFGYLATLLVLNKSYTVQGLTAVVILMVYTLVWMLYPGNGEGGPWALGHANMGGDFEQWLLGSHNSGYWVSLNAVPSTAQIMAGAMCGKLLASERSQKEISKVLAISALVLMVAGFALGFYIPIIKRILTASFALYSTGWAILLLLAFYWVIDVKGYKRWSFFLIVVGMNSIAAYVMSQLLRGWINKSVLVFSGSVVEAWGAYGGVLQALLVLAVQWYILYFFYKRKLFFKV